MSDLPNSLIVQEIVKCKKGIGCTKSVFAVRVLRMLGYKLIMFIVEVHIKTNTGSSTNKHVFKYPVEE